MDEEQWKDNNITLTYSVNQNLVHQRGPQVDYSQGGICYNGFVKIVYTKHAALDKFVMLKRHKFKVTRGLIKEVIENPEHEDKESDSPKIISSRTIDPKHVLRVVYRKENDRMIVITFYPAEKGRYY